MEVNKYEAERCRDMGAQSLRKGDYPRAVKLLTKSLKLYPLPGVEALLSQAVTQLQGGGGGSSSKENGDANASSGSAKQQQERTQPQQPQTSSSRASTTASASTTQQPTGACGRSYTDEQVKVVADVLKAKEGGRGAHYRVLGLSPDSTEAQIKKAYRKISLKVHPDKNAAPHADEAFKAVGLAYATLSDPQKRHIYDRYGEEDPDNRGGGGGAGAGGMGFRRAGGMHRGQEVSPEEIFNMFFGGGMPGGGFAGGPGFHVYSTGFGPGGGMHFGRAGGGPRPPRDANARARAAGANAQQADEAPGLGLLLQLLPILLIAALSFLRFDGDNVTRGPMPGEDKYFSLTHKKPFVNRKQTQLSAVKDIPYYVSDRFLHTYNRNRYQLGQVEMLVEQAYEQFLVDECKKQFAYKRQLETQASQEKDDAQRLAMTEKAKNYEMSRCQELEDLFPKRAKQRSSGSNNGYKVYRF